MLITEWLFTSGLFLGTHATRAYIIDNTITAILYQSGEFSVQLMQTAQAAPGTRCRIHIMKKTDMRNLITLRYAVAVVVNDTDYDYFMMKDVTECPHMFT